MRRLLLIFYQIAALVECAPQQYHFVKINMKIPQVKPSSIDKNIGTATKCAQICADKENRCFSFMWSRDLHECRTYTHPSPLKTYNHTQMIYFQRPIQVPGVWENPVNQCLDESAIQRYVEAFSRGIKCSGCPALNDFAINSPDESGMRNTRDDLRRSKVSNEICETIHIECDTNYFYITNVEDYPYIAYTPYPVGGFDFYCRDGEYRWRTNVNDRIAPNTEVGFSTFSCAEYEEQQCPSSYMKVFASCWKVFKRDADHCQESIRSGAAFFYKLSELTVMQQLKEDLFSAKVEVGILEKYPELAWSHSHQYLNLPSNAWDTGTQPATCDGEGAYLKNGTLRCGAKSQATHKLCRIM